MLDICTEEDVHWEESVLEEDRYGWTMWNVVVLKPVWLTVLSKAGASTTVTTLKMLAYSAMTVRFNIFAALFVRNSWNLSSKMVTYISDCVQNTIVLLTKLCDSEHFLIFFVSCMLLVNLNHSLAKPRSIPKILKRSVRFSSRGVKMHTVSRI